MPAPRRLDLAGSLASVPAHAAEVIQRAGAGAAGNGPPWLRERITGGWCGASAIDAQSYRLRIVGDAPASVGPGERVFAELEAPAAAGLRHARATLAQLLRQYGDDVPVLTIEDRPAFATRGVMLDVSRDRVPTMRHLFETVDLLAALKFNHLQLYTEHTFAYAGHEEAWHGWSPLTPAEMVELDGYAGERGIELAANQNCFGHLRTWLERPRYAPLAETHGEWMFDVWPRKGPFSLCPTDPASLRFVGDLLGQLLPCVRSGLVNIGCDEVYDIAYGRSRDEVSRRGRGAVFAEFVSKVCGVVREHGKRPMFWADIALSDPGALRLVPDDLLALAWGYEPDSKFDEWGRTLAEHGREHWVCPGTSSWRTVTGRTTERRGNLAAAARAGQAHGATGFLVCDWGDTGHWQQWPITAHALADAAQAAWNPVLAPGQPLPGSGFDARASSLHVFGDRSLRLGAWLERLGDADLPLREVCGALSRPDRTRLLNQSALFIDLFKAWDQQADVGPVALWQDAADAVDRLASERPSVGAPIDGELRFTLSLAALCARRGLARRAGGFSSAEAASLRDALADLKSEHERLWGVRSRPGGLHHSLSFFDQAAATLTPS